MKKNQSYLHGFDSKEQKRLVDQALFLEPYVFAGVDLEFTQNTLEVGCGVGAQTKILCRRFPQLKVHGVDLSPEQLKMAKKYLSAEIKDGQVTLQQQDAQKLKIKGEKFDSAFICWFLEHVPSPVTVLKNVKQSLKSGAKIYITEVFNNTLFVEPYSPAFLKYWFEFNDYQYEIKGHPFVGASLGHLLKEAGFVDIQLEFRPFHFDSRDPVRRAAFTEYFYKILLSAEKSLLENGRVDQKILKEMKKEVEIVKKSKNAVFYYSCVRATAKVPGWM